MICKYFLPSHNCQISASLTTFPIIHFKEHWPRLCVHLSRSKFLGQVLRRGRGKDHQGGWLHSAPANPFQERGGPWPEYSLPRYRSLALEGEGCKGGTGSGAQKLVASPIHRTRHVPGHDLIQKCDPKKQGLSLSPSYDGEGRPPTAVKHSLC